MHISLAHKRSDVLLALTSNDVLSILPLSPAVRHQAYLLQTNSMIGTTQMRIFSQVQLMSGRQEGRFAPTRLSKLLGTQLAL